MIAITFSFQNIFKIKDTWEIADRRETTTLPKILPSLRNSILGISSRKVWETFENSTFRSQNVFPRPNVYISPPSLYNVYKTTMYISHGGRYGSTCVDKVQRGFEKKKKKEGKKMPIEISGAAAPQVSRWRAAVSVTRSKMKAWVRHVSPPGSRRGPLPIPPPRMPDRCSRSSPTLVTYCCRGNNLKRAWLWAQQWGNHDFEPVFL